MDVDKIRSNISCAQARLKRKMILKENRMNKKCGKEFGAFSKSQHTRRLCTPLFDVTYKFFEDERLNNSRIVQCHKDKHTVLDSSASHRHNLLHRF